MSLITTVVAFFVVLGPLVFFHELGHFLFAKLGKIRVVEFGIGYPPRMWKFWQSAGRMTIGGVRLAIPKNFRAPIRKGEADWLANKPASGDQSAGFGKLDNVSRVNNVMDVMDNGRYAQATVALQPDGSRVIQSLRLLNPERDNVEPLQSTTEVRGEVTDYVPGTEYTLNWLPLGGFTRMLGEEDPTAPDSFAAAPKRWRTAVLLAGPGMNLLLAVVIFTVMYLTGIPVPKSVQVLVAGVNPGSPAATSGLQPNDIVLAANGQPITSNTQLSQIARAHLGQPMTIDIQRGQEKLAIQTTPRRAGEFDPNTEGPLGITIGEHATSYEMHYYPVFQAVGNGFRDTLGSVGITLVVPVAIIRGMVPLSQARPVGPVGIAQLAGSQAEESIRLRGLFPILQLAGLLSVAIGLTNLLPLPALDGGRLLFIAIEAIRRRRVDPRKETIVHLVGMALLLTLMVVITLQDILNPIVLPRTF